MQKYFEVGQIVNTFGINGTVKVKPFTDEIERFVETRHFLLKEIQSNQEYQTSE